MSANLPTSSEPIRSAAPSAAAASSVTMRNACAVVTASARRVAPRCSVAASRSAIQRSRSFPEIAPSVPSVTRTPAASRSGTRAMPLASFRFDTGLCDDRRPAPRQDRDLLVVEPDAMRQHRPRVEQPERVEMPDHRPPVTP